ncbi:uncharacterized protein BO88DRAFT_228641 [Aspergillus vadensis CBS 113365]|uniref:Uncharacterized protein n=1 Tax=Aspergillus vadensis (strain CBS 113365 / IMI 142717 / IBT 24658) TaxID=1448311 RepID=A0A319BZS2_ASPVC|nr:hypothetical protein BO88DRAFT_228641 [Aspergillus vadensis CBS 113365]PYH71423.1 hypothetical protein BO88DRAFT_228641 [Aspergillus vadensis CBS 113365]
MSDNLSTPFLSLSFLSFFFISTIAISPFLLSNYLLLIGTEFVSLVTQFLSFVQCCLLSCLVCNNRHYLRVSVALTYCRGSCLHDYVLIPRHSAQSSFIQFLPL